jgi:hypothetical protein
VRTHRIEEHLQIATALMEQNIRDLCVVEGKRVPLQGFGRQRWDQDAGIRGLQDLDEALKVRESAVHCRGLGELGAAFVFREEQIIGGLVM